MHHVRIGEVKEFFQRYQSEGLLVVEKMVSCEGFLGGGLSKDLASRVKSEEEFQAWVDLMVRLAEDEEETESTLGMADHLLVVARKLG